MTRRRRLLLVLATIAVALLLALLVLSRPRNVGAIVVRQLGNSLGLDIQARGLTEYRLRGTPTLVLRDVRVREPGAPQLLLRADRIHVSLPWSTLRAGGSELVARRIELDSPRVDLLALTHWLSQRPPSEKRIPTLTHGLRIRGGEIVDGASSEGAASAWRIAGVDADVPQVDPGKRLRARLRGRYSDSSLSAAADLALTIQRPQALIENGTTGFAAQGTLTVEQGKAWRLPATVSLSGPLQTRSDGLRIAPLRLGAAASYETGTSRIPFALGVHGPLRFDQAAWVMSPVGISLRPRGDAASDPVPQLDAHGRLALGKRLTVRLDGELAQWPSVWPALPPPISQSRSPLPFALNYDGPTSLEDVASLYLQRDATRFDGRFRLPQMLAWMDTANDSPLPPLAGTLTTPKIEISGATLEGVRVEFDDAPTPQSEGTP